MRAEPPPICSWQKKVNNLTKLFDLKKKNSLARLFLEVIFEVILDNESVIFGTFKGYFLDKNNLQNRLSLRK